MMRTKTRMMSLPTLMAMALVSVAGCSNESMSEEGEVSTLADETLPSGRVMAAYTRYVADPAGVSEEDSATLDAFNEYVTVAPALTQEDRDIIRILGEEMNAAGYPPEQIAEHAKDLPSYLDPRLVDLFTSHRMCWLMDDYDGNPRGTIECDVGESPYWKEIITKGITVVVVGGAIVSGAGCLFYRNSCFGSVEQTYRDAWTQCLPGQCLDAACAIGVKRNHENRCSPCGQNIPQIIDYRGCCKANRPVAPGLPGSAAAQCSVEN